jgi:DNA-directed RNA polymerase subunit L
MELELVERDRRSLKVKVWDEDHTLCNLLRKTLYEDEYVVATSYTIEHPLTEPPLIYVRTKTGKSPERALVEAAERIVERLDELRKSLREKFGK